MFDAYPVLTHPMDGTLSMPLPDEIQFFMHGCVTLRVNHQCHSAQQCSFGLGRACKFKARQGMRVSVSGTVRGNVSVSVRVGCSLLSIVIDRACNAALQGSLAGWVHAAVASVSRG